MKSTINRERSRKFGPVYSKKMKQSKVRDAERLDDRVARTGTRVVARAKQGAES